MLVDSHCHLNRLDLDDFQGSLDALIQSSWDAGLESMLCVNVDRAGMREVLDIASSHEHVYATAGLHPSDAVKYLLQDEELIEAAQHPKVVALGETGLDYYYHEVGRSQQQESFRQHIRLARDLCLPLIIHTRAAHEDTIHIMEEERAADCGGVMHCFTESWQMAEEALALGFYVSFSGIVTFKNAEEIREVARRVPLDRLLIETDAPYLTPVPYRGKPNKPEFVRWVAEKIAELKGIDYAEVVEKTTQNYYQLFQRIPSRGGAII